MLISYSYKDTLWYLTLRSMSHPRICTFNNFSIKYEQKGGLDKGVYMNIASFMYILYAVSDSKNARNVSTDLHQHHHCCLVHFDIYEFTTQKIIEKKNNWVQCRLAMQVCSNHTWAWVKGYIKVI